MSPLPLDSRSLAIFTNSAKIYCAQQNLKLLEWNSQRVLMDQRTKKAKQQLVELSESIDDGLYVGRYVCFELLLRRVLEWLLNG